MKCISDDCGRRAPVIGHRQLGEPAGSVGWPAASFGVWRLGWWVPVRLTRCH